MSPKTSALARPSPYPLPADLVRRLPEVAMPRAPRLQVPGATVHVVGRCNNREYCFITPADFQLLLGRLAGLHKGFGVTIYAYTLMANHVHLLLRAPAVAALARPLRWFFRETTRDWQRAHGRCGHFWERRYWSCLVEDDVYALAALRYLDRNPVRAGIVEDPVAYPWSSCAAYAVGAADTLIEPHPSYLALSPYAAVRRRHYRALLAPSADPRADLRDPSWATARAVGSPAFLRSCRVRPAPKSVSVDPHPRSPVPGTGDGLTC